MTAPRKRERGKANRVPESPAPDPFVSPAVVELSRDLASGKQRATTRLHDEVEWNLVPELLKPFIASCNLDDLEFAVRRRTNLYWHPVVRAQLLYLVHLAHDQREWARLGWPWHPDKEPAPRETIKVRQRIQNLVAAHAAALQPGLRIEWRPHPKKPGRRAGLRNPHPRWPEFEWIDARDLADAFNSLRSVPEARALRLPTRATVGAGERLRPVVRAVLEQAGPPWSALVETDILGSPPNDRRQMLSWFLKNSREEWSPAQIDRIAQSVVEGHKNFRRHSEGRPAFLAYVILANLLDTTPARIRDTVDAYRRSPGVRRTTRESSS